MEEGVFPGKDALETLRPLQTPYGLYKGSLSGTSLTVLVYVLKKRARKVSNIIRIQWRKLVYVSEIGAVYSFFP